MKEEEIRPKQMFVDYLSLAKRDADTYFDSDDRQVIHCPACSAGGVHSFTKHSFAYEECPDCQTLFVSPRPTPAAFARYYAEAESVKFWASTFYKQTADARREKLWNPKARMLHELALRFGQRDHTVFDIGGGYGIFAEEYAKVSGKDVVVIEPTPELAQVCRDKGIRVVQEFLEDVTPEQVGTGPKTFVSFEVFEHLHDPRHFLAQLFALMATGDLFIFTTLSAAGVDIQALWEHSDAVHPPHHLNFFTPRSAQRLLEHHGFEVLEISTPGKLDIDILCRNQGSIKDRFWRSFVAQASDEQKQAAQSFVSANGLSSHMLVVAQKPAASQ